MRAGDYLCCMRLQRATMAEFESVMAFYDDVIERTCDISRYARWSKGKHPTAEGIKAFIKEGSIYLYKEDDAIVGALPLRTVMYK